MKLQHPFVSVIIPTYHDWLRLKLCLDALCAQTYPHDSFEVIVVNNDPKDQTPEFDLPPNFKIISESKPGSYAARNKAISISKGEILAFADSDCIPYSDWIEQAVSVLKGGAERIAGRVELFYRSNRLTAAEIYEKAIAFNQEKNASHGRSVTANMITWRENFNKVGLFDDSLMSGGDNEWSVRAHNSGIGINYEDKVVVKHPARHNFSELLIKRRRVINGVMKIPNKRKRYLKLSWIVRGFIPPSRAYFKIVKSKKKFTFRELVVLAVVMYFLRIYARLYRFYLIIFPSE